MLFASDHILHKLNDELRGRVTLARHKSGVIKHISEVQNGKSCECFCLACGSPMVARHGVVLTHVFAHADSSECRFSTEAAINYVLAESYMQSKECLVPEFAVRQEVGIHLGIATHPAQRLKVHKVELRPYEEANRPDVVLLTDEGKVVVRSSIAMGGREHIASETVEPDVYAVVLAQFAPMRDHYWIAGSDVQSFAHLSSAISLKPVVAFHAQIEAIALEAQQRAANINQRVRARTLEKLPFHAKPQLPPAMLAQKFQMPKFPDAWIGTERELELQDGARLSVAVNAVVCVVRAVGAQWIEDWIARQSAVKRDADTWKLPLKTASALLDYLSWHTVAVNTPNQET